MVALLLFDRRHQLHAKSLSIPPLEKLEHAKRTTYTAPKTENILPCPANSKALQRGEDSYQNTEGQTASDLRSLLTEEVTAAGVQDGIRGNKCTQAVKVSVEI